MARVTWRAAVYAANLARGRNNWPNDSKTKTPVPEELKSLVTEEPGVELPVDGRVRAIRRLLMEESGLYVIRPPEE